MKAISKTGKVFSERFAKTAIKIGIGKEVTEVEETNEEVENIDESEVVAEETNEEIINETIEEIQEAVIEETIVEEVAEIVQEEITEEKPVVDSKPKKQRTRKSKK